ncbi:hypothetical protein [Thermococcus nautili]|uniref:hypothetical protein n=1 Tax=Thermococcus nautili TaxID=195522 RepID=UPI002557C5DC|nr:hypothetical protein [Thermococcus nautili]
MTKMKETYEVVGTIRAGKDYVVLEREGNEKPFHFIVSKRFWEANKDAPLTEVVGKVESQKIERVISKTIFLLNGAVLSYYVADEKVKEVFDLYYRRPTKNGLLEKAVALAEGSDSPKANAVLKDIVEILYYKDFSEDMKAPGIPFGLGYPGDAYGVMVGIAKNLFEEELYVIFEEVHSYVEGYIVRRYKVPARFLLLGNSEKFDEVIKIIQDYYKDKEL